LGRIKIYGPGDGRHVREAGAIPRLTKHFCGIQGEDNDDGKDSDNGDDNEKFDKSKGFAEMHNKSIPLVRPTGRFWNDFDK
jgi:hypothetical protein